MAKSYPFESKNVSGSWDRAITAQDERDFNKLTWTNGVFASPVDGLLVTAGGGMKVNIKPGGAHIEGAKFWEGNNRQISLPAASNTLPRIDRIVLRFDTAEDKRSVELYLKEGVPATSPSPQDLIRQSNYWELAIADIYIPKQATEVTNSNIIDRRLDPSLCGLVVPAIPYKSQTEQLWLQIKDSIDLVNAALSGTTAGSLQAQITTNKNGIGTLSSLTTTNKLNLVAAVNEVDANNKKIADYVVERQAPNGFEVEKYQSGRLVVRFIETRNFNINAAGGDAWFSPAVNITLPSNLLKSVKYVKPHLAFLGENQGYPAMTVITRKVTTASFEYYLSANSSTEKNATVCIEIVGTWK